MGVNKLADDGDPMIKRCRVPDNDKCIILFEYFYEAKEIVVRVLKEKICPEPVNVIGKDSDLLRFSGKFVELQASSSSTLHYIFQVGLLGLLFQYFWLV